MQESQGEAKTKNLAKERARRNVQVIDGEKPPKLAEVYAGLAKMINGDKHSSLPKMAERFATVEFAKGARQPVMVRDDDSLELVSEGAVVNALQGHIAREIPGRPIFTLSATQAKEAVRTWMSLTTALVDVPYTRWLSEPGYCWRRIPFDLVPDEGLTLTPTWNRLLSKIEDADERLEICALIGSFFEPRAFRQQYGWIYGRGGNGKGCIARILHRAMGQASHFVSSIPKEPNQFWTAQFVRRRLIVIPDCDKHAFPASGLFKTLTGDDPVTVERKHQEPYTASLDAIFLFTSNEMPTLSSERADMRRAILVRMDGAAEWEADFEERLWGECGAFLWHCVRIYREMCPAFGPIPVKGTDLRDHVAGLEGEEQDFFDRWFALDPGCASKASDVRTILRGEMPHLAHRRSWNAWLRRAHGLYPKSHRVGGVNAGAHYVGMRIIRQEYAPALREERT